MKTSSEMTAYALGELSPEEEKALLEKLQADGVTEEEISKEVENLKNVTKK